jgi:VanZ family protein
MSEQTSRIDPFRRLLWICLGVYWFALMLAIHWPMPFHASHFVRFDDKFVHLALYGGLALVLCPLVDTMFAGWPAWKRAVGIVIAVALQGGLDEITQPLTQRTTDILDLVADTCGAILAVLIYRAWIRRMMPSFERGFTAMVNGDT